MMRDAQYIIRLDDASEYMTLEKGQLFFNLFEKYDIKPIVAVIPAVKDRNLIKNNRKLDNFWDFVRGWHSRAYTIALHGLNHLRIIKGLMNHNNAKNKNSIHDPEL